MDNIRSNTFEQYCEKVKDFHGAIAPGMLVAGFMVDLGCRNLPADTIFDVICETAACLPDAVQILTPCSAGNQWMRIVNVGRFAVTLYDKHNRKGIRIYLNVEALERWPAIKEWFLKLKPKQQQDRDRLLEQIKEAGTDICGIQPITVSPDFAAKFRKTSVSVCPVCNEGYRSDDGAICPACAGESLPYQVAAELADGTGRLVRR